MTRIITVHGSFAHQGEETTQQSELPWWKPNSAFAHDVQAMVQGTANGDAGQPIVYEPFVWSGENSEVARRTAGAVLLNRLRALDASGEAYCVVGHSHGGSVIASALLDGAGRRIPLKGLKSWITVGTPFVEMQKMSLLFERLTLIKKVILVASLMLFLMFICFVAGQLLAGNGLGTGLSTDRTLLAAFLLSIPALFVTALLRYLDQRSLFFYRPATIKRAQEAFASKWTSFWHPSDEAVQGLRTLKDAKVKLFEPSFAVQRLTLLAVFMLPIMYLLVVTSPPIMVSLADYLRDNIYKVDLNSARSRAFDQENQNIRSLATKARSLEGTRAAPADWNSIRNLRRQLTSKYPDHLKLSRALRFEREFLEDNGKPCPGHTLCGQGHSFAYNSKLLYHLVSDNVTSAIINDDTRLGIFSVWVEAIVPMIVVPVASIAVALVLTLCIRWLAQVVSNLLSRVLNRTTLAEIKREIYGNDTDGEVAVGASPHPAWLSVEAQQLPPEVADPITKRANEVTNASLAKFRNAIGEIVLAEGHPHNGGIVSNYLTWKELVHTCYFDLPEFRKLFARAVADSEGFAATAAFTGDPDYARTATWLAAVRGPNARSGS